MSYCDKCGFSLPDGAGYCPNCGSPVKKKTEVYVSSGVSIGRILQAGIMGAFISVMISSFSPPNIDLYFIPSFLASLIAIYLARARKLEEAVAIAFTVYIFTDAIIACIFLGTFHFQNVPIAEAYGNYVPTLVDVVMYTINPITAIIAGYIGTKLTAKMQVRGPPPITYRRKEEPGGVIYNIKGDNSFSAHKV